LPKINPQHVSKAKRVVRQEYPEMAGTEPTVSASKGLGKGAAGAGTHYVLTFKKSVPLPGGGKLMRTVRVTMDQAGEIVKLSSSK
jgi:hypothetical protein